MYRLFSKLFGWKYVVIISPVLDYRYIERVLCNKNSEPYVHFNGAVFLLEGGICDNGYTWKSLT